jgi:pimeloyl-ACP methyl ester carboxylesterase
MASRLSQVEAAQSRVAAGEGAGPWDLRMTHDPEAEWRQFRGPVLALFGEWDTIVPAVRSAERLRRTFHEVRHPDFRVVVFPRAHHSLFLGRTGAPSEFARMEGPGEYVPGYWDTLLLWLDRVGG